MSAALVPDPDPTPDPLTGHDVGALQSCAAGQGQTSPPSIDSAISIMPPTAGTSTTTSGHDQGDSQGPCAAGGPNSDGGQGGRASQGQNSLAAVGSTPPPGHAGDDPQHFRAGRGPILEDQLLSMMAETVHDLEELRKATANRYGYLTKRVKVDKSKKKKKDKSKSKTGDEWWGLGLPTWIPQVEQCAAVLKGVIALEAQATNNLEKHVSAHPLWTRWAKEQKGVGAKQFARLLATLGDPYWNTLYNRPRTVSELWSYSGYAPVDGQAMRATRGQKMTWSPDAKMRAHLIALQCVITGKRGPKKPGPTPHYRQVFEDAVEKYAYAVHDHPCARCGHAEAGTPLSADHKLARAHRLLAKEILKDLWEAARDIHAEVEANGGQPPWMEEWSGSLDRYIKEHNPATKKEEQETENTDPPQTP